MAAPNIKAWVHERILFLALVIFVAGGVAYISAAKIFPHGSIWLDPFKEFSLLIAMIGVVSLGYETFLRELTFNEYKNALQEIVNPDAVRLGIVGIYKNRSELGRAYTFDRIFKMAQREIFIGGSSLLSIATSCREMLREKILRGMTVKLLLMDPESPVVEMITRQAGGKSTFKSEILTALLLLQKLHDEIDADESASKKGKLLVRTYEGIPSHSFISVDGEEINGMIVADIGPYLGRNLPRPSMVVTRRRSGIYDYWREMNSLMWDEGKPVAQESPIFSRTKTLMLVSGEETECYDAKTERWQPASICQMSGKWRSIKGSQWVWIRDMVTLEEARTGAQNLFRVRFKLPDYADDALIRTDLFVRSDDSCRIAVNDVGLVQQYGGADYPDPFIIDIGRFLRAGENTITFELNNFAKPAATAPEDNPAGLTYRLHIEYKE